MIATILQSWYAREGRALPWRETRDPYRIWLSEVILQQTRIAQGTAYYLRFVQRFPDVQALAAASEDEVLKLWQGLGYYSRARNLHAAAKQIVADFDGIFPTVYDDVRRLRGVGDYTAAAICSFAYNAPYAVLDGNVFRVLSRLFDVELSIDTTAGKKAFAELAQTQLDAAHSSAHNQAIMDFGALVCTPANPQCGTCPLSEKCLSFAAGTVAERPVKQGKTKIRERWLNYLHITCGERTLLHRREEGDIWQGLYEFPLVETPRATDFTEIVASPQFEALLGGRAWRLLDTKILPPHQLTHQRLYATVYRIDCQVLSNFASVPTTSLGDYAVPRLLEKYLLQSE